MTISYKPLWKLLIDRNIKKKDLCQMAGISPATVTKMGKGGQISTSVLEKICTALNCSLNDIVETISDTSVGLEAVSKNEQFLPDDDSSHTETPPKRKNPFDGIDISTLVDICDVKIDTSLPVPERIKSYIDQIKNPYYFRVGDIAVHVTYTEGGPSLQEIIEGHIKTFGLSDFSQCPKSKT